MRRGHQGRVDGNQAAIVDALRQIPGVTVLLLSAVGRGCPDICAGVKGKNYLLEVKAPGGPRGGTSRQALTDPEREWHRTWRGQAAIVTSIEQALYAIGAARQDATSGSRLAQEARP